VRTEELTDLVRSVPFRPFTIGLADGSGCTIEHPEWIAFRGGRTAVVLDPEERVHLIDVKLALKISVEPPVPRRAIAAEPNGSE
jgi:hypothetical protein